MEKVRILAKTLLTLLFIGLFQTSYAVTVDKIIAFGDSLSDNGNLFSFTKRAHKIVPFVPVIPMDPPYYKGRFSNGENWLDILAKETKLPLLVHAYGGAWAEPVWESAQLVPFDIADQVALYIVENAFDRHKNRHLFIIWAGANDYLDGREDIEYATTNTVKNIQKQVERLIFHGARQLMVMSLPDVSSTPAVVSKGPNFIEQIKALVNEHNKKLTAMIKQEQEKYSQVTIVLVDTKKPLDQLAENSSAYRLKNVKQACYDGYFYLDRSLGDVKEVEAAKEINLDIMNNASLREAYMTSKFVGRGDVCHNPDEYLFWDRIHPTRVIHQVIATLVELELKNHHIQWEKT